MKKINGIALTEKGVLKASVRTGIVSKVEKTLNPVLAEKGYVAYPERKSWAVEYEDLQGNKVYATLSLTVGTKSPDEKAVKKTSGKKSSKIADIISIDED